MKLLNTHLRWTALIGLLFFTAPLSAQDSDMDGAPDMFDNCPTTPNPGQLDTDSDGRGNACDNCPFIANPFQENTDSDGFGNVCDNCPSIPNDQADADGDGLGDACDGCPFNCDDADPCTFDVCVANACQHFLLPLPGSDATAPDLACHTYNGRKVFLDGSYSPEFSTLSEASQTTPGDSIVTFSGTVFGGSDPCYAYVVQHEYSTMLPDPFEFIPLPQVCKVWVGRTVFSNGVYVAGLSTLPEGYVTVPGGSMVEETVSHEDDGQFCYNYVVRFHFAPMPVPESALEVPPAPEPCKVYVGRVAFINASLSSTYSTLPSNYVPLQNGASVVVSGSVTDDIYTCLTYHITYHYEPVGVPAEVLVPPAPPGNCFQYVGRVAYVNASLSSYSTLPSNYVSGPGGTSIVVSGSVMDGASTCLSYDFTYYYEPYAPPADYLDPPVINCFVYVGRHVVSNFVWDESNSTLPFDYENPEGGQELLESETFVNNFVTCWDYIVVFFYVPLDCNDNDPCTDDFCGANGVCQNVPIICDDGDACTVDFCDGNGICQYVAIPEVKLAMETDVNGEETNWEIRAEGSNNVACSGSGYMDNATTIAECCLPNGCYTLHVMDDGEDGIAGGGYVLRDQSGQRIIDNSDNFTDGGESAIGSNGTFCLPVGNDRLLTASCDRLDLRRGATATCSDRLTADNTPNSSSGNVYQFWFFDPNGGLSFRYPANTGGPNQVNMINLPALVEGELYNVRVRTRTSAGVWREWGPACRLMINNTLGQCPATKLQDTPNIPQLSCEQTKSLGSGGGNLVHAKPKSRLTASCVSVNANKYQFRFRLPGEGVVIVKSGVGANPWTYLNMANLVGPTMPTGAVLQACKTYEVEARASFDGGITWCVGGDPYTDLTPWGDICNLFTAGCSGGLRMAMDRDMRAPALVLYPNPNEGQQLFLSIDQVKEGVNTVSVDIHDTFGKRVSARTIAVADGYVNTALELNGELAAGLYVVNITAGDDTYTERLVIQP